MTSFRHFPASIALASIGLAAAAAPAMAQTIISDTFTTAASTAIAAHTPDINVPGGAWTDSGNAAFNPVVNNGVANVGADGGAGISIAGATSLLTITASVDNNTVGTGAGRGTILGFFTVAPAATTHGYNNLDGIILGTDGSLALYQGGAANTPTIGTSVAFGGTYSETTAYTLSYSVNLTTGSLTSVSLSGSTANYSGLFGGTVFTAATTPYAGFATSAPAGGQTALVDNFSVTGAASAPEPNSLMGLLAGAAGLCAFKGRRILTCRRSSV